MFLLQYNTLQLIEKDFEILCTTSQTMTHNAELEDTWNHMKPAILIHGWHELSNISSIHTESFKGTIKTETCHEVIRGTRLTFIFTNQEDTCKVRASVRGDLERQELEVSRCLKSWGWGWLSSDFVGREWDKCNILHYITIWHDDIWYKHSN